MFPPIPTWENLHPLVIHFPIALLLSAPLFVAVALIFPARGRWASWAATILLIGGTAGVFLSVATGEAARDLVKDGADGMLNTLERHEQLAEISRIAFAVLTGAYVVLLALPLLWKKLSGTYFHVVTHLIFLLVLLGAGLLLANAAQLGGRLVHEFGVHADLGAAPAAAEKPDGPGAESPKPPKEKPDGPEAESPTPPEEKPDGPEAGSPTPPEEKPDGPEAESPKPPEEKPDGPEAGSPTPPEEKPDGPEAESPKPPEEKPDESEAESPKPPEEKPDESQSEPPRGPEEKPDGSEAQPPKAPQEKPEGPESELPKDPQEKSDETSP